MFTLLCAFVFGFLTLGWLSQWGLLGAVVLMVLPFHGRLVWHWFSCAFVVCASWGWCVGDVRMFSM